LAVEKQFMAIVKKEKHEDLAEKDIKISADGC